MTGHGPERLRLASEALGRHLSELGTDGATQYRPPGEVPQGLPETLREIAALSTRGSVAFASREAWTLVVPPFPLAERRDYDGMVADPLLRLVARSLTYAVFLLRLGGFAVGVYRDDALLVSKVDQRFVKNRNRKGGQSQRRFERIREKQIDELFKKACETARERLSPFEDGIQWVVLGGDRRTMLVFRRACDYIDRFGARLRADVLPVPGDPRHATLLSMPRAVRMSDVYVVRRSADAQAANSTIGA